MGREGRGEDGVGKGDGGERMEGGKIKLGKNRTPSVTSSIRQCILGMMIMLASIMCQQANLLIKNA